MTKTCPSCTKTVTLNNNILKGIKRLAPGRTLRLPCPHCNQPIVLSRKDLPPGDQTVSSITPPSPPDITWLKEGIFEEEEIVEDVPQTLILIKPGDKRDSIAQSVESIGYQASFAESGEEAMEKMQFVNYASVILHSGFEETGFDQSQFHQFMKEMSMVKRRFIFYILIGTEFSTLYDLEALAFSANLVVNDLEIPEFLTVLRKAIPRYEELFGSLMAEISAYSG